jgi:hypothetical protein
MSSQDPAVNTALGALSLMKGVCALPVKACRGFQDLIFQAPGQVSNLLRLNVAGRYLAAAMNFGEDMSDSDRVCAFALNALQKAGAQTFKGRLPEEKDMPPYVQKAYQHCSREQISKLFAGAQDVDTKRLEIAVRMKLTQYNSLPKWLQEFSSREVPEELVRDVFFHGKTFDNRQITALADHYYTPELIADANNRVAEKAMGYGIAAMAMLGAALGALQLLGVNHDVALGLGAGVDTFNGQVLENARESASAWSGFTNGLQAMAMAITPLSAIPTVANAVRWHLIRAVVSSHVKAKTEQSGLHLPAKEVKVEYEKRLGEKKAFLDSRKDQLDEAKRVSHQPLINIGVSTGLTRSRGFSSGLEEDVTYRLPMTNLFQNTIVLGGTGSGKTATVLLPIIRQVFRFKALGQLKEMGWYVTDSKGVLWEDVLSVAIQEGFGAENVIVIGSAPGNYGCNITKGILPVQLTNWIDTIAKMSGRQSEGGSGFYKAMSSYWGTQFANIAWAYSHSIPGAAYQQRTGSDPYCLKFIFELATNDEFLDEVIMEIQGEINGGRMVSDVVANADLIESMRLVNTKWQDLEKAKETKTNIQATLISDLGPLLSNGQMSRLFFEGRDNLVVVDEHGQEILGDDGYPIFIENQGISYADVDFCFQGKGVCINVSSERDGEAGSCVLKMLASRFRILSGDREVMWKSVTEANKRSPDYNPEDDLIPQDYSVLFIGDEYQDIAMKGGTKLPVGDDAYWNKSRSKGVIGLIATQSISSIEQFMGNEATTNMLLQFRNKILLQTEDTKTISYFVELGGKTMRMQTFGKGYFERQAMRELVLGGVMQPVDYSFTAQEDFKNIKVTDGDFEPMRQIERMSYEQQRRYLESIDRENSLKASTDPMSEARAASEVDIEKSTTDMEDAAIKEGNNEEPLLRLEDVIGGNASRMHGIVIAQHYTHLHVEQVRFFSNYEQEAELKARQAA